MSRNSAGKSNAGKSGAPNNPESEATAGAAATAFREEVVAALAAAAAGDAAAKAKVADVVALRDVLIELMPPGDAPPVVSEAPPAAAPYVPTGEVRELSSKSYPDGTTVVVLQDDVRAWKETRRKESR